LTDLSTDGDASASWTSAALLDDLTERLKRVDLLLLRAVMRQRARPAVHQKGQYWGQFITDDEVDALLRAHGEIDLPVGASLASLDEEIDRSITWRDHGGDDRYDDTEVRPPSRVDQLMAAFDLDGDDLDLLLLALAPEISAGYGKIFAYLNDDLNRNFLTVDLATRILRTERHGRLELQNRLLPGGPLITHRLLSLTPEAGKGPHSARRAALPPRILQWLVQPGDLVLEDGATRIPIDGEVFVPAAVQSRLDQLAAVMPAPPVDPRHPPTPHLITLAILGGTPGMREGVAMAVARAAGRSSLVRVDLDRCKTYLDQPHDLVRDLRLSGDIPYVVNIPDFSEDPETREKMMRLGTAMATLPHPICVGGKDRRALTVMLGGDRPRMDLPVGRTTVAERKRAWNSLLDTRGWAGLDTDALAYRFSAVGGTTMSRVLDRVAAEVGFVQPSDELVQAACREASRPEFQGLVQHVVPRYSWDDLVLTDKILAQLRQLEDILAQQEKVMHTWGQQRLRPRGYGLKALFSGSPGTGKTMCAEVIAGGLGYDLYKVDLSSVVSKWVGETEKNLRQIFDAAEGGTSVLLFDEGDAIFGSRGDNKSAQDKYANQEVAYLLQRLEVFEGCVIITTNLQENIDEAFLRRFGAVIEFPFPSPPERQKLWERALPDARFRDDDIDVAMLSRHFHLAGGSIVNAAINACIDAAARDERLAMRHCVVAVARELFKMGKQVNRVNFGPFFDQVEKLFT
jgi:AAA+ superfamily predicted ATPase